MKKKVGKAVSVVEEGDAKEMDCLLDRLETLVKKLEEIVAVPPEETPEANVQLEKGSKVLVKLGKEEVKGVVKKLKGEKVVVKIVDKKSDRKGEKVKVLLSAVTLR